MPVQPQGSFQLPNVPYEQKLEHCLRIMTKQHEELVPLRKERKTYHLVHEELKEEIENWREKYKKTKEELRKARKENGKLKKEIEKLTKTKERYRVALFDHGNFTHLDRKNKKEKGGQKGHKDTNRESYEDTNSYQKERLFVQACGQCGSHLQRVSATRQKILLDIVLNPQVVKLIVESERQWCGRCKMEVYARDSRTLPFTEYGINTFLLVMILRFKAHASMTNIAAVLSISHGLDISVSGVANLLKQAKTYLKGRYEKLLQAIREGQVLYADETGWLVNGKKAWLWIMANEKVTVYFAAESRGKGIAEELYEKSHAYCMHDGLTSYLNALPKALHCYCWAHMLRFAYEETVTEKKRSRAVFLKEELVKIYHIKKEHPEYTKENLESVLRSELDKLLVMCVKTESFLVIQRRLSAQKEGLINSLLYTPDGTNNLAERELRPMVITKKISNGSNTFTGMETSAVLGSIIQTLARGKADVLPQLTNYLTTGIKQQHKQYMHTPLSVVT